MKKKPDEGTRKQGKTEESNFETKARKKKKIPEENFRYRKKCHKCFFGALFFCAKMENKKLRTKDFLPLFFNEFHFKIANYPTQLHTERVIISSLENKMFV